MKLGIETYSETDWRYGYIVLNIDNKRWKYIFIEEDFIAFQYPDTIVKRPEE